MKSVFLRPQAKPHINGTLIYQKKCLASCGDKACLNVTLFIKWVNLKRRFLDIWWHQLDLHVLSSFEVLKLSELLAMHSHLDLTTIRRLPSICDLNNFRFHQDWSAVNCELIWRVHKSKNKVGWKLYSTYHFTVSAGFVEMFWNILVKL